jgi:hypothetical protein
MGTYCRIKSRLNRVKKIKVLLDTSVLLQVYEGIDVLEKIERALGTQCEFYVLDAVLDELIRLSQGVGRRGKAARLAISYMRNKVKLITFKGEQGKTDDIIMEFMRRNKGEFVIATNDKKLRKDLKKMNVKIVTWWLGKYEYAQA